MKIVVTGALGHIGSRLIRELPAHQPGAEVIMIDNLSTQRYASLFNLPPKGHYRFVEADVITDELEPLIDGADLVIHLAAITDAEASHAQKERVERENYTGTQRVAEASLRAGAALLFASTTSIYGSQKPQVDEDCPASDLEPQSPYAATKLREEELLRSLGDAEELRFVVCRLGTIAGTSAGMRFHTAVNKLCWQAVMGQPLSVWRTALHQVRPYLDLEDAVRAMYFLWKRQLFDGQVYNTLTANQTIENIVDIIRSLVPDVRIELVDSPIMNQISYAISNDRLVSTGFQFKGRLDRSISDTIALLRSCATARLSQVDRN